MRARTESQQGVGYGENLLRLPFAIRHVTLAADGQQQGVNAGGVDGVDGFEAG